MPLPHDRAAVHSLPSFAQAFSSLSNDDNALPPIHHHRHAERPRPRVHVAISPPTSHHHHSPARSTGTSTGTRHAVMSMSRKRLREVSPQDDDDGYDSSDTRSSPRSSMIKEENDYDQLEPTPPPPQARVRHAPPPHRERDAPQPAPALQRNESNSSTHSSNNAAAPAPPPSLSRPAPPLKRRRVTISGVAHPLNTSNLHRSDSPQNQGMQAHTGPSTPISPVVMGFTIGSDPQAMEQVRAMLSVKQKQKALIESRRGSVVGLADGRRGSAAGLIEGRRGSIPGLPPGVTPVPSVSIVNPTPTSASASSGPNAPAQGGKRGRASPNGRDGGRLGPAPAAMTVPSNAGASASTRPATTGPGSNAGGGAGNTRAISPAQVVPSQNHRPVQRSPPTSAHNMSQQVQQQQQQAHQQIAPHTQNSVSASPKVQPTRDPAPQAQPQAPLQSSRFNGQHQELTAFANALPPPPNSFAQRRASQLGVRGNKPADIVISPRDSDTSTPASGHAHGAGSGRGPSTAYGAVPYKALQPAVQSAPPRPGQQPGRFPMALPSLPPALPRGTAVRRTVGQVPPTPTRLSMQRAQGTGETSSVRLSQPSGAAARSPGLATSTGAGSGASVGSGALGLPRTPATVQHNADKRGFLAPFEQFFDTLKDAQVLKEWFREQLGRVGALAREVETQKKGLEGMKAELERQREEAGRAGVGSSSAAQGPETGDATRSDVAHAVSEAVQRELDGLREEVVWLRTQVEALQSTLADRSRDASGSPRLMEVADRSGRAPNGILSSTRQTFPVAPGVDAYTFPPVQSPAPAPAPVPALPSLSPPTSSLAQAEPGRRTPSPLRKSVTIRSAPHSRSPSRSEADSPAPSPFVSGRRLSVSAMRYEPPRPRTQLDAEVPAVATGPQPTTQVGSPKVATAQAPNRSPPTSKATADPAPAQAKANDKVPEKEKEPTVNGKRRIRAKAHAQADADEDEDRPALKRHNSHTGVTRTKAGTERERSLLSRPGSREGRRSRLSASPPKRAASPMDES